MSDRRFKHSKNATSRRRYALVSKNGIAILMPAARVFAANRVLKNTFANKKYNPRGR